MHVKFKSKYIKPNLNKNQHRLVVHVKRGCSSGYMCLALTRYDICHKYHDKYDKYHDRYDKFHDKYRKYHDKYEKYHALPWPGWTPPSCRPPTGCAATTRRRPAPTTTSPPRSPPRPPPPPRSPPPCSWRRLSAPRALSPAATLSREGSSCKGSKMWSKGKRRRRRVARLWCKWVAMTLMSDSQ